MPSKRRATGVDHPLPLLPLRDIVVFPHMVVPLFVGRKRSVAAVEAAMAQDKAILLSAQRKAETKSPAPDDLYSVGTVGHIIQLLRLPDGTVKILVEGRARARLESFRDDGEHFLCEVSELSDEKPDKGVETEGLIQKVLLGFDRYVKVARKIPQEARNSVANIGEPGRLADTIAAHLALKQPDKQALLESLDPVERLRLLAEHMQAATEMLLVERKVQARLRQKLQEGQQGQAGRDLSAPEEDENDEFRNELRELEEKIRNKSMPRDARTRAKRELRKLKMMAPVSAEATVVRNYVEWILALPWEEYSRDNLDIDEAQRILDEDHYGLDKVKERILEYLAVQSLVERMKGPILCFVGPPGVGKTSLARSIGRATDRKYVRLSLGGVRDEAEIRGHRRTYIGALPGKLIQSLKRAGTSNPVFLLDEVDKMSTDFRGDPSSALLEVLDPEQNFTFNDHYLDLDYDLSRVMFITTANTLHSIPLPLQDRMEIIELSGYTEYDKLNIASKYLVPKQRKENGLENVSVDFTDGAISLLINSYTREAGVRGLEREIASIFRKIAKEVVREGQERKFSVTQDSVAKYLGPHKHRHGKTEERDEIGLANGLAVTNAGGDLLTTEVTVMPGKGKLITTGKLGDVMQESARAALSYVRSRADRMRLVSGFYQKTDIHIHVPEGAIPKDGPSAGITMATSLASALTQVPVRRDVAMTGEITLRGRVLPVGGVKEKLLAAHRGGVTTVIIPKDNEKDLRDIPKIVRQALKVELVEHMDDVLDKALRFEGRDSFLHPPMDIVSHSSLGIRIEDQDDDDTVYDDRPSGHA